MTATPGGRAVVLVGPMGAGKTSIGKRVARTLGCGFVDTDALIVAEHGPIAAIFAREGEGRFRALERDAVRMALDTGGIVALGGGAVVDPDSRAAVGAHRVVYLTVEPRVVRGRLRGTTRPLIAGGDPLERWSDILAARAPVYQELADLVVDTSTGPMSTMVDEIVAWARGGFDITNDDGREPA